MKKILFALAAAIVCSSAEAQVNCTVVPKKKTTVQTSQANTCKLVPKDVCTISPDRKSVMCYKSVDPNHFERYGSQTSYYGPSGATPGRKAKFETETVVIKGPQKTDYCTRDEANRTSYCYLSGYRMCRDENGNYFACRVQENTSNSNVKVYNTKNSSGNNGVVLK